MGRWFAALVVAASVLAAGIVAFLNGGDIVTIHLPPSRVVALPLGTALAIAFGTGAALVALLALGSAVGRAFRDWRSERTRKRTAARLQHERVRAESLLTQGDPDAARVRLAEAVTAHGGDERLLELLAGASEQSGDLAGAVAAVEEAHRRLPESPLLARRLRSLYATAGRWEDALALENDLLLQLRSPAALADETPLLCGLRYEAAMADADPAHGLRRLLALTREHPSFAPAWVAAGDRLRAAGRRFRARHVYERGARVRPTGVLLDRVAAMYAEAGRPDRALAALRRLLRRHPSDPDVVAHLVRSHLQDGTLDDAEALLAQWPASLPAPPAIEALRGELHRRRGSSEQALVHFVRAAAEYVTPSGLHRCSACGQTSAGWVARCTRCGRWDTTRAADERSDETPSADLISLPSRNTPDDLA